MKTEVVVLAVAIIVLGGVYYLLAHHENALKGGLKGVPNKITTVYGTSQNAKGGAIVQTDTNQTIYIENLDSWPLGSERKRVSVSGVLVEEKTIPDPEVDSGGSISQGALGTQSVMKNATWKIEK